MDSRTPVEAEPFRQRIAALPPEKRALLERQLSSRQRPAAPPAGSGLPTAIPDPDRRHEPFPLTDIQQAYWVGRSRSFELGNVAAHLYEEIDTVGLDLPRLELALRKLIARHDMLRAVVREDGLQQVLAEVPPYRIAVLDLSGCDPAAAEAGLAEVRRRMSHQVLPSDRWPLFELSATRLDTERVRLHLSLDILIGDAWSWLIFLRELVQLYRNPRSPLPPLELTFRDYVLAEHALRQTELYQRSLDYWLARIPSLPPPPELPTVRQPGSLEAPRFSRRTARLEPAVWEELKARASREGLTSSGVLLGVFAEVLAAWSRHSRFTLNITLFNRLPCHPQVDQVVGDFTTLTLLAVDNSRPDTFPARARRIQAQLLEDLDHRHVSGIRVLRELFRSQGGTTQAAMPVVFTSILPQVQMGHDLSILSELGQTGYGISQTPQLWLDHQVLEDRGALVWNWDTLEDLFPDGFWDEMFAVYSGFVRRLAVDGSAWSETVRGFVPPAQIAERRAANATAAPVPESTLHGLFAEQAARLPEEAAILTHDGRTVTYGELARLADGLAGRLLRLGARSGELVGVVMEKGWEQVAAVLGILQTGAAYLPIDADVPPQRLCALLRQGETRLVVTSHGLAASLCWPEEVLTVVPWADEAAEGAAAGRPSPEAGPDSLAYVIYTSGSTGTPKGVMIRHRAAVNTLLDVNRRFGVGPGDRLLGVSSLSFDLSVYDIFGVLAAGATLVLPDPSRSHDPAHWYELADRHGVTVWSSVPALMELLVDHQTHAARRSLCALRLVLLSGDWIPLGLPAQVRELGPGAEVVSLGGATEASIWSIFHRVERVDPSWRSIPYGRPLANQSFHVLDETLQPRPVGVPGKLYIGGLGLADGYWRDEEGTRARFILHSQTGERLYDTGDLGRYRPGGEIEILGREDFQVKVNGYRIECGEIESVLCQHPAVRHAVVLAQGEPRGRRHLAASVVAAAGATPDTDELRSFLAARLPAYMVPSRIRLLGELPLTANGKVDHQALAALEPAPRPESRGAEPPRTPAEVTLAGIWAGLLGLDAAAIGVHDNFFGLGGDSVLVIQMVARARERGLPLLQQHVYLQPTIAELALAAAPGVEGESRALPLTARQRWFFERQAAGPAEGARLVVAEMVRPLSTSLVARALAALVRRHDALRLRFEQRDRQRVQIFDGPASPPPVQELDLSALDEAGESQAVELVRARAARDPLETGIRGWRLCRGDGRPDLLLLTLHPLVADAGSWRILLADLDTAVRQLLDGDEPELPPAGSFRRWAEQASGAARPEVAAPVPATSAPAGAPRAGAVSSLVAALGPAETRQLLDEVPAAYHTRTPEVLLAAVARASSRCGRRGSLWVELHEPAAAPPVPPRTVGCFTVSRVVRLELPDLPPGEALKLAKEQLRASRPGGGPFGSHSAIEVAVSFEFQDGLAATLSGDGPLRLCPERTPAGGDVLVPAPRTVHLAGVLAPGGLELHWRWREPEPARSEVEVLARETRDALLELIAHCRSGAGGYTPSDFGQANISQKDLDKLVSRLGFTGREERA